ncbi:MAG: phage major capsid protein [Rickettsiaceae bacterium]|nr:phage major capsid protein [Rickettsiaceae bacterium]
MEYINKKQEQIATIAANVTKFIDKETKSQQKITEIEKTVGNMQKFLSRRESGLVTKELLPQDNDFNNYIRKGEITNLVTKALREDASSVVVTPTLYHKIISSLNVKSPIRRLASIERISSASLDLISQDGDFNSGWIGHEEARPDTNNPNLTKAAIHVHELYAMPKATQRLLDDTEINIENWLVEKLADSFTKAENQAFITGDGNKKPFGLLTRQDKIAKVNATDTVTPELFLQMIHSLDEEYLANATFIMNRSTLAAVQGLKDQNGRFIWQQSLSDPLKQTIFGIPVTCISYMPDIANDSLSIAIGDFKAAYKIVDRSNITLMRDPYTEKPFVKFYAVKRIGGDLVNSAAIKLAKFAVDQ